eukprot:TRINITY_DN15216_c0_g1_i1.p1 TRINITY_DN15216_c0_g1~~TRINITY_DN15216_c0_g1_i1.p1  ORF type:complete len:1037 (+),score=242.90 TRINITY_DN15216_c0_g1_i1:56-3166(+)
MTIHRGGYGGAGSTQNSLPRNSVAWQAPPVGSSSVRQSIAVAAERPRGSNCPEIRKQAHDSLPTDWGEVLTEKDEPERHTGKGLAFLKMQVSKVKLANKMLHLAEKDAIILAKRRELAARSKAASEQACLLVQHERNMDTGIPAEFTDVHRRNALQHELGIPKAPEEAMEWVKNVLSEPSLLTSVANKHFKAFDIDGDHFIGMSEVPALAAFICSAIGVKQPAADSFASIYESSDANCSGKLSRLEFVEFFREMVQILICCEKDNAADVNVKVQHEMDEEFEKLRRDLEKAKAEAGAAKENTSALLSAHDTELAVLNEYISTMEKERKVLEEHSIEEAEKYKALLEKERNENESGEALLVKLQAELAAAQQGADSSDVLALKLEQIERENKRAEDAHAAEKKRILDMLQQEDKLRRTREEELASLSQQLAAAEHAGSANARELLGQLDAKNAEHETLMLEQQNRLNSELEQERKARLAEIEALRRELADARESGSTAAIDLQKRIEEKNAEHAAKLEAQHHALNEKLENERLAADIERERLCKELQVAQQQGAANAKALQQQLAELDSEHKAEETIRNKLQRELDEARYHGAECAEMLHKQLREKDEENEAVLRAREKEMERLRSLLEKQSCARRGSVVGVENIRDRLLAAKQQGDSNTTDLEKLLADRTDELKSMMLAQHDSLRDQFEKERLARHDEMEGLRGDMKSAHAEGLETDRMQKSLDMKVAEDHAISQTQAKMLAEQLNQERAEFETQRQHLSEQLAASKRQALMSEAEKQALLKNLQRELETKQQNKRSDEELRLQEELKEARAQLARDAERHEKTQAALRAKAVAVEVEVIPTIEEQRRPGLDEDLAKADMMIKQSAMVGNKVLAVWAPGTSAAGEYTAVVASTDNLAGTVTVNWDSSTDESGTHRVCSNYRIVEVARVKKFFQEGVQWFTVQCLFAGITRQFLLGTWRCKREKYQVFIDTNGNVVFCPLQPPGPGFYIVKLPQCITLNVEPHQTQNVWRLDEYSLTAGQVQWFYPAKREPWVWTRI